MKFDKDKKYGNCLNTKDFDEIEQMKEIILRNAEFVIPEEFLCYVTYSICHTNTVALIPFGRKCEIYDFEEEGKGETFGIPEVWQISWEYIPQGTVISCTESEYKARIQKDRVNA